MILISKKADNSNNQRQLRLVGKKAPFAFVEAYNSLRTNVDYIAAKNRYKTILITSSGPDDGKTTTTINLAVSMANSGKRVLLVDADFRKATLASYLRISRSSPGITSVLSKEKRLQDVIVRMPELKIDVLPVGFLPANPAELCGSPAVAKILQLLGEAYDYVFVDTPPVSVVTDAAILSRVVDGTLLIARSETTTKQALNLAKKNLEDVNANILGVVLNGVDFKTHGYGGYNRDYRYGYGESGGKKKRKLLSSKGRKQSEKKHAGTR
jgi:capsular exopolysaccharide synthesis family protein